MPFSINTSNSYSGTQEKDGTKEEDCKSWRVVMQIWNSLTNDLLCTACSVFIQAPKKKAATKTKKTTKKPAAKKTAKKPAAKKTKKATK